MSQLYHRRRGVALRYPQMEPQRLMLEALGIDGMSSEEEMQTPQGKKYFILVSKWRSPLLIPWLRVFDSLYSRQRNTEDGDQRGCLPRQRRASTRESTSRKWVPGLPSNAYRSDWLEQQPDVPNVVHPSDHQPYTHDPMLSQCVLIPHVILLVVLTSY